MSTEPRKRYVHYKGQMVENLSEATIFGVKYIDILLPNGMRKTVPASACQTKVERKDKQQ